MGHAYGCVQSGINVEHLFNLANNAVSSRQEMGLLQILSLIASSLTQVFAWSSLKWNSGSRSPNMCSSNGSSKSTGITSASCILMDTPCLRISAEILAEVANTHLTKRILPPGTLLSKIHVSMWPVLEPTTYPSRPSGSSFFV